MKNLIAGITLSVILASCSSAPTDQGILEEGCLDLFKDNPDATRSLLAEYPSITLGGFCDCYAQRAASQPAIATLHKDVLNAINTTRTEKGLDVEGAVKHINAEKEDSEKFSSFTIQQLDGVGDYFQSVAPNIDENGTCKVG